MSQFLAGQRSKETRSHGWQCRLFIEYCIPGNFRVRLIFALFAKGYLFAKITRHEYFPLSFPFILQFAVSRTNIKGDISTFIQAYLIQFHQIWLKTGWNKVQKNAYNSKTRHDRKLQPLGGCRKMKALFRKKYFRKKSQPRIYLYRENREKYQPRI